MSNVSEQEIPGGMIARASVGRRAKKWRAGSSPVSPWRVKLQIFTVLFKTRVVSLLVLAAVGGAFLGAGGWPGLGTLMIVIIAGGLAASGAAGLNEYLEQGPDAIMGRTRSRPLVTGDIKPRWALLASAAMVILPPLIALPFNPALAFFLCLGAFIYVGLYTLFLKPRTLLNIVIGGAAGSAAVMSGGAAAGNWQDPAVITLALLVFLWTPSHFWSLAILYKEDYTKADVPMLPVKTTLKQASWWVLLHTGAAGFVALLLAFYTKSWMGLSHTRVDSDHRYDCAQYSPNQVPKRPECASTFYLFKHLFDSCIGRRLCWHCTAWHLGGVVVLTR